MCPGVTPTPRRSVPVGAQSLQNGVSSHNCEMHSVESARHDERSSAMAIPGILAHNFCVLEFRSSVCPLNPELMGM